MSDFDREQSKYWYTETARRCELIGRIGFWADAPLDKTTCGRRVTPARALAEIRRLLTSFATETGSGSPGSGGTS